MKEGRLLVKSATSLLLTTYQVALNDKSFSIERFVETNLLCLPENQEFTKWTSLRKQKIQSIAWNLVWSSIPFRIKEMTLSNSNLFIEYTLLHLTAFLRWTELSESNQELITELEKESSFMSCFGDILQITTIGNCSSFLRFFFNNLPRILICALGTLTARRQLLLMSTSLLKRANSTLNQDVVSLVLQITSSVFKFNDKSILNVKSTPNLENITVLDNLQNHTATPDSAEKSQFYTLLWQVQENLVDTKNLLESKNRPKLTQLLKDLNTIIVQFSNIAHKQKEHLRNPAKEKLLEPAKQTFFFSKFLTSRELFDAQITDPYFRRQILVEILLLIGGLLFFTEQNVKEQERILEADESIKRNTNILPTSEYQWLSLEERDALIKIRVKATIVLSRIPPSGTEFVETIFQLLKDEAKWTSWKMKYCNPDILPSDSVMLGQEISYKLLGDSELPNSLGNPQLNRLCDGFETEILKTEPTPDILEWTKQIEEEAKGDIDPEYQLSKKEMWKWQTYRLFLHKKLDVLFQPVSKHVIRDFVRRIQGQPEMTESEVLAEEERRREQLQLEMEIEEERRKVEEEELRLKEEEEEKERKRKEEAERRKIEDEKRKKERLEAEEEQKRIQEEKRKQEEAEREEVLKKEKELQQQQQRLQEAQQQKKKSDLEKSMDQEKKEKDRSSHEDHEKPRSHRTKEDNEDRTPIKAESGEYRKHKPTDEPRSKDEEHRVHGSRASREDLMEEGNGSNGQSTSKDDRHARRQKKWDENRPKLDVPLFNRLTSNVPAAPTKVSNHHHHHTSPHSLSTSSSLSSHSHSTSMDSTSSHVTDPPNGRLPPRPNVSASTHLTHKDRDKRSEILGRSEPNVTRPHVHSEEIPQSSPSSYSRSSTTAPSARVSNPHSSTSQLSSTDKRTNTVSTSSSSTERTSFSTHDSVSSGGKREVEREPRLRGDRESRDRRSTKSIKESPESRSDRDSKEFRSSDLFSSSNAYNDSSLTPNHYHHSSSSSTNSTATSDNNSGLTPNMRDTVLDAAPDPARAPRRRRRDTYDRSYDRYEIQDSTFPSVSSDRERGGGTRSYEDPRENRSTKRARR